MSLRMKYFVLKPKGNSVYAVAARKAMIEFAKHVYPDDPDLSIQLRSWALQEARIAKETT